MFDVNIIKEHSFCGSIITDAEAWSGGNIVMYGEFPAEETERSGCRFFYIRFGKPELLNELPEEIVNSALTALTISEREGGYSVALSFKTESGELNADFDCGDIFCMLQRYKGMSYRNLYGTEEYDRYINGMKYVLDGKYLTDSKTYELPEDYTLETETYSDVEEKSKNYSVVRALLIKCALKKSGETVYEYLSADSHIKPFTEFFTHSNGHRYYPFHIELYGISYLELDTMRVNHYIPEGHQHDHNWLFGESFIVTELHYDINTDLIAYGGCYWASTNDVMVGMLGDPMNFSPKLVSLHEIIDPEYEMDDIDFVSWGKDTINVTADGKPVSVDISEITDRLRKAEMK